MKKRGFTVVELAVSFSLVSVIAIMLFQLILSLKELYVSGDIKTTLLNKQGIMTKKIYDDLEDKNLITITSCGVSCLNFNYEEGSVKLLIDVGANTIAYDSYVMKLSKGSEIGQVKFEHNNYTNSTKNDSVFTLDIPIFTSLLEDDFGIHIVKIYNSNELTITNSINLSEATIVANGIEMPLSRIEDDTSAIFAKIFHQKNGNYFTDYNEFLKSNNENKKSTLKSLEVFRTTSNIEDVKTKITENITSEKEISKVNESLQDGYFELILDYPNITSGVGSLNNYNWWLQSTNFTNNTYLYTYNIDAVYPGSDSTGKWLSGLYYLKNSNSYVAGTSNGLYFAIGTKEGKTLLGPTGEVNEVDLWIRVNDYINKYSLSTLIG